MKAKQIAAFDLDGTLLNQNSSLAFCQYLTRKNLLPPKQLRFCYFWYTWFTVSRGSLMHLHRRLFNRLFRNVSIDDLTKHVSAFLDVHFETMLFDPTVQELKRCLDEGIKVCILSSSPDFIVAPIAKKLGVEHVYASAYTINDRSLVTDIDLIIDGAEKARILGEMEGFHITAYSDSIVDLPFLEAAAIPVAVNPDRRLRRIARRKRWDIVK